MAFNIQTRFIAALCTVLATAILIFNGTFIVSQTELAYKRRLGKVVNSPNAPYTPGWYIKIPFVDRIDTIRVSTDTLDTGNIDAYTGDTQKVTLLLSLTYAIPHESAYNLLYNFGRAGNIDIDRNINAIVNDRVRSIIGQYDIATFAGKGRQDVVYEIKQRIQGDAKNLLGINIYDVQFNNLTFSETYERSIAPAVAQRAEKVRSEIQREQSAIEAQSIKIKAAGQAEAVIEEARGNKEKRVAEAEAAAAARELTARAEAEAIIAVGNAEAAALRVKVEAAGGPEHYIKQLHAQAQMNWKGDVPTTMLGSGIAPTVPVLPLPALGGK